MRWIDSDMSMVKKCSRAWSWAPFASKKVIAQHPRSSPMVSVGQLFCFRSQSSFTRFHTFSWPGRGYGSGLQQSCTQSKRLYLHNQGYGSSTYQSSSCRSGPGIGSCGFLGGVRHIVLTSRYLPGKDTLYWRSVGSFVPARSFWWFSGRFPGYNFDFEVRRWLCMLKIEWWRQVWLLLPRRP